jgi:predicted nucleic acid-binding protein
MRVFLDADILFSAAKSNGAVRSLLRRLHSAGHALVADSYVVAEARRNLLAKGPEALGALDEVLLTVELATFRPVHLPQGVAAQVPEQDRPIISAAVRLHCNALVTGDRTHFGALYGTVLLGVAVHSPRSLAESLNL